MTAQEALQAAIGELLGAPLEEFVAERTRLAKDLRRAGDRARAAELAKLPKPTAAAWALNHVARKHPEAVGEWFDAAAALRDASSHPQDLGPDALRAAITAHRAATEQVLAVARERARPNDRRLSEAMLDRARTLLTAAAADAALAERVRAGLVSEEQEPGVVGDLPVTVGRKAEPGRDDKPSGRAEKSRARGAAGDARAAARRRRHEAERAERAARRERLGRDIEQLESRAERLLTDAADRALAARSAGERLEEARRVLHRCESEAAAAQDALAEAEAAAAAVESDLQRLRSRLAELGSEDDGR